MDNNERIKNLIVKHSKTTQKRTEGENAYHRRISIISLAYLGLTSLPYFRDFPSIRIIRANNNKLTNIGVQSYPRLEVVDISNNELSFEAIPITGDNVKEVDLSCNKIEKLVNINSLQFLQVLNVSYQKISTPLSLSFGPGYSRLRQLDVSGCLISSLSFTSELTNLETLIAKENLITEKAELGHLTQLDRLGELDLRDNPISKDHNFFREVASYCTHLRCLNGKEIFGSQLAIAKKLNERP